jgi:predicted DNA-binding transcriptional regulator YafY
VDGPGRAAGVLSVLKEALGRQVEVEIEYFSRSRGTLSTRRVRPYGIYEQSGRFYLAAFSDPPGRVVTLRADRMRSVTPSAVEYDIPDDFEVAAFRREKRPEPEAPELTARIRFDHDASRWAREFFPATEIEEAEDKSAIATVRTSGRFWLVSELLLWGGRATVLEPEDLRREVADRARETLLQYGGDE